MSLYYSMLKLQMMKNRNINKDQHECAEDRHTANKTKSPKHLIIFKLCNHVKKKVSKRAFNIVRGDRLVHYLVSNSNRIVSINSVARNLSEKGQKNKVWCAT